jgi:hypothetical protein
VETNKNLLQRKRNLLATNEYYLATNRYCLAANMNLLATNGNYLATNRYCLAANVNLLATNGNPLATNKYCLLANGYRLERNRVVRLGGAISNVRRQMENCAIFFFLGIPYKPDLPRCVCRFRHRPSDWCNYRTSLFFIAINCRIMCCKIKMPCGADPANAGVQLMEWCKIRIVNELPPMLLHGR